MKSISQARPWLVLCVILLALGGLLRLIDITDPPLDFQPSRQLRNSLVARDIYYSLLPSATTEQRELASSFARSVGQYEPPVIESIVALTYLITGGESTAAGDGANGSGFRSKGDYAGSSHFTQHVNFVRAGRSEIKVIIGLQGDILRKIAPLKKAFEIHRNTLAVAQKKAVRKIGQFNSPLLIKAGLQAAGTG